MFQDINKSLAFAGSCKNMERNIVPTDLNIHSAFIQDWYHGAKEVYHNDVKSTGKGIDRWKKLILGMY